MKPLRDDERKLAETAARVIAKAAEIGLPDPPDKLVTPHAIQFLALAYLDLLDRVEKVHAVVGDLEQLARTRSALAEQLRSIQGYLDEIAKTAIEGALRDRDDLKDKWRALLANISSASGHVDTLPGARRRSFPKPELVTTGKDSLASSDSLVTLYCRVMHEPEGLFTQHASFVVRVWDGMDGCWTDCTGEVGRDEALTVWADRTDRGTRQVSYAEIDYYRIFPGGTRMLWDGSDRQEMRR